MVVVVVVVVVDVVVDVVVVVVVDVGAKEEVSRHRDDDHDPIMPQYLLFPYSLFLHSFSFSSIYNPGFILP